MSRRRRTVKEARLLLREARRVIRKGADRLTPELQVQLRASADRLARALDERQDEELVAALNTLDAELDRHLGGVRKSTPREYTESIVVAIVIALFLRAFVVEAFKIPSGSMIPTLQVGDHIFVNKFIYGVRIPFTNIKLGMNYRKPHRGEVIVFKFPNNQDIDFIKRIVAVEGDTVEVRNNQVFVNGQAVPRSHVAGDCRYEDFIEDTEQWQARQCEAWVESTPEGTYTTFYDKNGGERLWPARKVPPGNIFAMGDNRDNSNDSRFWGFVPFELIKGKAMVIWWSLGEPEGIRFGRLFHLVH